MHSSKIYQLVLVGKSTITDCVGGNVHQNDPPLVVPFQMGIYSVSCTVYFVPLWLS